MTVKLFFSNKYLSHAFLKTRFASECLTCKDTLISIIIGQIRLPGFRMTTYAVFGRWAVIRVSSIIY